MRNLLFAAAAAAILTLPMTAVVRADSITVREHPNGNVTVKDHDNDAVRLKERHDNDEVIVRDRDRVMHPDNDKLIIKDR